MCAVFGVVIVVFFKQKTAYEMRISDWSSDVCSSDLRSRHIAAAIGQEQARRVADLAQPFFTHREHPDLVGAAEAVLHRAQDAILVAALAFERQHGVDHMFEHARSEEHTSELQSLMRISYAVFCLNKKIKPPKH